MNDLSLRMRSPQTYELLLAALSHEIRTPLSVISNEANYLQMTSPLPEHQKILDKVHFLSELLKSWRLPEVEAPLPLSRVKNTLAATLDSETFSEDFELRGIPDFRISEDEFRIVVNSLVELFHPSAKVSVYCSEGALVFSDVGRVDSEDVLERCESFAELFIGRLGRSKMLYCRLDAIFCQMELCTQLYFSEHLCQIKLLRAK